MESQNFKRSICRFWEKGKCRRGKRCTFAHGQSELREFSKQTQF